MTNPIIYDRDGIEDSFTTVNGFSLDLLQKNVG